MQELNEYTLSPIIATITTALAFSYVLMYSFPSFQFVFSTMTNVCFVAAAYQRELVSIVPWRSASALLGLLAAAPLVYLLLGASSLAFHADPQLNSPAHSFDILFGWLLVMHVAYVCAAIVLLGLVQRFQGAKGVRRARPFVSVAFVLAVILIVVNYDAVYKYQAEFIIAFGAIAAVFGGICRFSLTSAQSDGLFKPIFIAIVEILVALTTVVAAILAQCELLGIRYQKFDTLDSPNSSRFYDFYHGMWHALLALVTALLYSRVAIAARLVSGQVNRQVACVCTFPTLDYVAVALLFVYSVLVAVLKETRVDLEVSKAVLVVILVCFGFHAIATAYYSCKRHRWPRARTWSQLEQDGRV